MARELTDPTLELLEEFTVAWSRGENPDPRVVVARAPQQDQDGLRVLIDRFLERQPAEAASAESLAYVRQVAALATEQPVIADAPLVEARVRLGLRRDAVVSGLREALGLDPSAESKLRRYYHQLESGLLDTERVSGRVWDALESILQWRGDPARQQPLAASAAAFFRANDASPAPDVDVALSLAFDKQPEPADRDAVDELFLGPGTR